MLLRYDHLSCSIQAQFKAIQVYQHLQWLHKQLSYFSKIQYVVSIYSLAESILSLPGANAK